MDDLLLAKVTALHEDLLQQGSRDVERALLRLNNALHIVIAGRHRMLTFDDEHASAFLLGTRDETDALVDASRQVDQVLVVEKVPTVGVHQQVLVREAAVLRFHQVADATLKRNVFVPEMAS